MKNLTAITMAGLCLIALMIGFVIPACRVSDERFLSDARQSYRASALVVSGECISRYTSASGKAMSTVKVEEVMAGDAGDGMLQIEGSLDEGKRYLLYLAYGEDVPYAEDELSYVPVSAEAFVLHQDGSVEYGGSSVSMVELRRDMAKLNETVTMPAAAYYYDTLSALFEATDSIFIGRVNQISPMRSTRFRSQAGGSTVEKNAPAALLTVSAYGSVKGSVRYGQELSLVYSPGVCDSIINGGTLLPHPCREEAAVPMEAGDTYLFFLDADPDPKQAQCFPINPIQGWVRIEGDRLEISPENTALEGYADLGALVSAMNRLEE